MDEPLIAIENIKITEDNIKFLGKNKNTLKVELPDLSLIQFFITDENKEKLKPSGKILKMNIVGKCDKNFFAGKTSPQIKIDDFEVKEENIWDF